MTSFNSCRCPGPHPRPPPPAPEAWVVSCSSSPWPATSCRATDSGSFSRRSWWESRANCKSSAVDRRTRCTSVPPRPARVPPSACSLCSSPLRPPSPHPSSWPYTRPSRQATTPSPPAAGSPSDSPASGTIAQKINVAWWNERCLDTVSRRLCPSLPCWWRGGWSCRQSCDEPTHFRRQSSVGIPSRPSLLLLFLCPPCCPCPWNFSVQRAVRRCRMVTRNNTLLYYPLLFHNFFTNALIWKNNRGSVKPNMWWIHATIVKKQTTFDHVTFTFSRYPNDLYGVLPR